MTPSKKPNCPHTQWTVPGPVPIKAEDSQEILGIVTLQVCIKCAHVRGYVQPSNELQRVLFEGAPLRKYAIDFSGDADIGVEARKALSRSKVNCNSSVEI
jgi:hypothetical protein